MSADAGVRVRLALAALDVALSGLDTLSADPGWRWVLSAAQRARGELVAVEQLLALVAVTAPTRPMLRIVPPEGR